MKAAWKAELALAEAARKGGNEGRARVCARRAAGAAAREFLRRKQCTPENDNAYQALLALSATTDLPADLRRAAAHLTLRVNQEFKLPVEADLIADARLLCEKLIEA